MQFMPEGGSDKCGKGPNDSGGSILIPTDKMGGRSKGRRKIPSIGISKFPLVQRGNGLGIANRHKIMKKGQHRKWNEYG
jgi:hypothetical protein